MNLYMYTGTVGYPEGSPNITDIAVSLSRESRYAGAGVHWWPVALHTFVVCDLLPMKLRLHGLLHDAAECVTGDIPKPAKTETIEILEGKILASIYKGFGLKLPTPLEAELIHIADKHALHGEVHTVGTKALRSIYPEHPRAAELVTFYQKLFPPLSCIDPNGLCVQEFKYRFERYKEMGGF
jgi:hypothetical protein